MLSNTGAASGPPGPPWTPGLRPGGDVGRDAPPHPPPPPPPSRAGGACQLSGGKEGDETNVPPEPEARGPGGSGRALPPRPRGGPVQLVDQFDPIKYLTGHLSQPQ